MPNSHWVLVAERRGKPTRQRQREIVYCTDQKAKAEADAKQMAAQNKRMRYYVMTYEDLRQVAERELADLENALADASKMKKKHISV